MNPLSDIDEAFERFKEIASEVPPEGDKPITESTTRLQLIDPILVDVLGWPRQCIDCELPAAGDRLDYRLRESNHTWFVLEAKKRAVRLVKPDGQVRERFALKGAVIQRDCWEIISQQMASYLGRHNPDYGVVTNGEQWVGFLHKAKISGRDLEDDYGVVFRSLKDIEERFEEFFNFFSLEGARGGYLHRVLEPDTQPGFVRGLSSEPVVGPDEVKALSYQDRKDFYAELQVAIEQAFQTIQDNPDALAQCFVETRESLEADSRLERCAQLLTDSLDHAAEKYAQAVEGELDNFSELIEDVDDLEENLKGRGVFVRLTGEESSGKSVFLRRFYEYTLPNKSRSRLMLLWLDARDLPDFSSSTIAQKLLSQLRKELFGATGPDVGQFRDLYVKHWVRFARRRGLEVNKPGGDGWADFVAERERLESDEPFSALVEHLWYVVRRRQLLPCIIYDNVDSAEAAKRCSSFSVALHGNAFALSTVALQDMTVWELRESNDDLLSDVGPISLWLPRPKVRKVIENRVAYLRKLLADEDAAGHRAMTRIGKSRGLKWDVDADDLARAVSAVLLGDQKISNWLGEFCNHNLREVLDLCRQVILSPHVKAEDLLSAQVVESGVHPDKVLRAIISPRHVHYVPTVDGKVLNVFGTWDEDDWAPLLPFRLLVFLREKMTRDLNQRNRVPGFVSVANLLTLFGGHLRIPEKVVLTVLRELWTRKLVETEEPHRTDPDNPANKISITPRGDLHIRWALEEAQYVQMMAEIEPIIGEQARRELSQKHNAFVKVLSSGNGTLVRNARKELISTFVKYVLSSAHAVSQLPQMEELEPLRQQETKLLRGWVNEEGVLAHLTD